MADVLDTERPISTGSMSDAPRSRSSRRSRAVAALLAFVILAAIGGFLLWQHYSTRESTDDAQVEGHIHPISAKVLGIVAAVNVQENQTVNAGDILVQLGSNDYQIALERAKADLAEAEANLQGSEANLPLITTTTTSQLSSAEAAILETQANLASSEKEVRAAEAKLRAAQARVQEVQANVQRALRDWDRFQQLIAKEEISQQQYDTAVAAADAGRAALESSRADVAAAEQSLRVVQSHVERDRARITQAQAGVQAAGTGPQQLAIARSRRQSAEARVQMAKAAVHQAELSVQYTTIRAPVGGQISRKSVETGQIVQVGQPLLAIVPIEEMWVVANFKETQLSDIRVGQPAVISVDAYGGRKFKGHVDSISAATGARFSLLPPENATGNYVKVVQRVPVKIVLEPGEDREHLLRLGMSAAPTVFTK